MLTTELAENFCDSCDHRSRIILMSTSISSCVIGSETGTRLTTHISMLGTFAVPVATVVGVS